MSKIPQIDVLRLSASRPDLIMKTTPMLRDCLKFSGCLRWILHEDFLNGPISERIVEWAKTEGKYNVVAYHDPPIGHSRSLDWLLNASYSDYVIQWEDDYEPIQDIDLDELYVLLENNKDINQISFQKRAIMGEKPGFKKVEIERDGIWLTTNPHWAFIPAIWRSSWIKPKWEVFSASDHHWKMNKKLKEGESIRDADWVVRHTGTYYLGRIGSGHYVNHLGRDRSLRLGHEQEGWS
jgi:hypothetical protein